VLSASLLWLVAAQAQDTDPLAARLDRPVATQRVPPKAPDDAAGQMDCTYYDDFMLRETGTDTPDPNDATLIPIAAGAPRPTCDASQHASELPLKTQGYSYIGRRGDFLLFSATDPNGAVPFMVLHAGSGKMLFEDGTLGDHGIRTVTLEDGVLHLSYTRAFNASCSLLKDNVGCWASLVAEGKFERGMPQPSPDICAASYKAESAPTDDPSIISHDVDTRIDAAGNVHRVAQSTLACAPMP
jgi:hypothetical protein